MSSPKKIGRWNRFEIAFNEGVWPKPSFLPSAPSRASEKTGGLRKIVKETPNAPFADLALLGATPTENVAPSKKTPVKPSPENKTPTENVAPSKKTPGKPSPSPENKTPTESTPEGKTAFVDAASLDATPTEPTPEEPPLSIAAELKETPVLDAAKSPTLWAEARQRAAKAKKSRF